MFGGGEGGVMMVVEVSRPMESDVCWAVHIFEQLNGRRR
jgi:hypothetical protein